MKIDITGLLSTENLIEDRRVEMGLSLVSSRMGEFPIKKKLPFTLHLENQGNRRLLVSGETDVTVAIPCGRCLEEVPVELHLTVERVISLEDAESNEDSGEDGAELAVDGFLDIDRMLYDEVMLAIPMNVLCREGCKGICRVCGVNLNHTSCSCDRTVLDPRMASIQDIFKQCKEV